MSRYVHAPDDAPLYRVSKALGGNTFPAYRVWDDNVVLDVDGELYEFKEGQVTLISRPEGLPDWAVAIILRAIAYEEVHSATDGDGLCFGGDLEQIPAEAREYLDALRAAGGAA